MTARKPKPSGMVKIVCTVDRLILDDGTVLVRDQVGECPAAHAASYIAQGRAAHG